MVPWRFSKPKGIGFGISKGFYLSVLSSASVLETLRDLVEPKGALGAIEGFIVPLAGDASKEALGQPLRRGAYGLSTRDRKTVLRMLVMSCDEAGYNPETFARSSLAATAHPDLLARMRGAWTMSQFTFESHDPEVYPAIDFLLHVAARHAAQSQGVVADPISRRYLLPQEVLRAPRLDPKVDARELVSVQLRVLPSGIHAYTLGMQKFGLPELELLNLLDGDAPMATRFLMTVCQTALAGDLVVSGDKFGHPSCPLEARDGGFDRGLWEGIAVFELLPPTAATPSEALAAWGSGL
ncbi:MAG: hypothetical protein ACOYON_02440 [Fimbriimonas sp.]